MIVHFIESLGGKGAPLKKDGCTSDCRPWSEKDFRSETVGRNAFSSYKIY